MKSLPSLLLTAFATLTIGTFAGCGHTTYEIYPSLPSANGDSSGKDVDAGETIVTAPSGEIDESKSESLSKIEELEAKIDELNQKIAASQTDETPKTPDEISDETPKTPDPTPDPEPTPIADPKPDDQAPLPTPEDPNKIYEAAKDSRVEAAPAKKTYSVSDTVVSSKKQ